MEAYPNLSIVPFPPGRDLRGKLRAGEQPDPRVMRPETSKILIETMKGK